MTVRCRICKKDQPAEQVGVCREALRHMEAATRGGRCPACGRDHLTCVRFEL
jgi:4-hydroxy-3-methylbut-2-en-1-yl diphosphate synthase IspG/GcpE